MTRDNDIDTLAKTLYGEAEAHNAEDAHAIANVVMNRLGWNKRAGKWRKTVAGICLQPMQFSCWNAGDPGRERIASASGEWYAHCKELAAQAVNGKLPDITRGSTHYYATYIKIPKWARNQQPDFEVRHHNGNHSHLFFNGIDTAPPPPETAKEALDQERPLAQSRTMRAGAAVAATGTASIVSGLADTAQDIAPAIPVAVGTAETVQVVAATVEDDPYGLIMVLMGIIILGLAGYILFARWDDRRKGRN